MEHKAFLFDSSLYHKEIEPVIKKCCKGKKTDVAIAYIDRNHALLKMPDSGENLESDWQDGCGMGQQELFDILLTRCYEPDEDMGLEYAWDGVLEAVKSAGVTDNADLIVLGKPLVYNRITVDPGCEGLGIVEADEVSRMKELLTQNLETIKNAEIDSGELLYELEPDELAGACDDLCGIYTGAAETGKGILFTF